MARAYDGEVAVKRIKIRNPLLALALLAGCATTKDCGSCGYNNSEDAERVLGKQLNAKGVCIEDGDEGYLCSSITPEKSFRCASAGSHPDKMKCIPWFPTE